MSVQIDQVEATLNRLRDVFHSGLTRPYEYRYQVSYIYINLHVCSEIQIAVGRKKK